MNELESRLENWGKVMRDGFHKGHCRSIEYRYTPERIVGESWDTRQAPKPSLDHRDAATIEEAWRKVHIRRDQQVLKLAYVWRAPSGFICRRLSIENGKDGVGYQLALGRAQRAIKRALEVAEIHGLAGAKTP